MLRTASLHPAERGLSLRFDGGLSPDAGSQLPGTLASPRVGLSPTGRAQLRWAHRGNALLSGKLDVARRQESTKRRALPG